MNIGMVASREADWDSLTYLYGVMGSVLQEKHTLLYRTTEFLHADPHRRSVLNCEFLSKIDILFGPVDLPLLEARATLQRNIPYVLWTLGVTGRGLFTYQRAWKFITRSDLFIGTCRAELAVLKQFFSNARSALVYLPVDTEMFRPITESQRRQIREQLSISANDPGIIYSGRVTLEKNVHTVFKIFAVLRELHPNAHLIIAGDAQDIPFLELRAFPISIERTLKRLMNHYAIPGEYIHFLGRRDRCQLRQLYAAADVAVNMTLHHDENFGLAQVEAMACGTPVVGSGWGGLLDTVGHDGVSCRAFARPTPHGVKLDWPGAVSCINRILLQPHDLDSRRERIRDYAHNSFSMDVYRREVDNLLKMVSKGDGRSEPIRTTAFADQYWEQCGTTLLPQYRLGTRFIALYQAIIAHYTGTTDQADTLDFAAFDELRFFLHAPLELSNAGWIYVEDLIFPAEIRIPDAYVSLVHSVQKAFMQKTFLKGRDMREINASDGPDIILAVVAWMYAEGLLGARHEADEDWMDHIEKTEPNTPALRIDRIQSASDIAVLVD